MGFTKPAGKAPFRSNAAAAKPAAPKEKEAARKPDFVLKVKNPDTGKFVRIGGGWKNDNGSIHIRFDEGFETSAGPQATLFENDYDVKWPQGQGKKD